MELLFGDSASGGLVPSLVVDAGYEDKLRLAKLILNIQEERSGMGSYAPTPILQNILDRLGSYNETVVNDVKDLIRDYDTIYGLKRSYAATQGMFASASQDRSGPSEEYLTNYPKNIQRNPPPTLWSRNIHNGDATFSITYSASECYNLMKLRLRIRDSEGEIEITPVNKDRRENIVSALEKAGLRYSNSDDYPDRICVKIERNFDAIIKVIESLEGSGGFTRGMTLAEDISLLNSQLQGSDDYGHKPK